MNLQFSENAVVIKTPQIICAGGEKPPESLNIISQLEAGHWITQVAYHGAYHVQGVVMQSIYCGEVLSIAVNDRQRNMVYRYTPDGEDIINAVSCELTQKCGLGFFLCPQKPNTVLVHHSYIRATLPIIDEVKRVSCGYELTLGSFCEETHVDVVSRASTGNIYVNHRYKILVDTINDVCALSQVGAGGVQKLICVSSLSTGKRDYALVVS